MPHLLINGNNFTADGSVEIDRKASGLCCDRLSNFDLVSDLNQGFTGCVCFY